MKKHTTFKTGGKAELFAVPAGLKDLTCLLKYAKDNSMPFIILGGGANILVSDRGIKGMVIDMSSFSEMNFGRTSCTAGSGFPVSDLAALAGERGLKGLEFIYGMPGSVGGAVWMNARCYEVSVSDILLRVDYLDENMELKYLEGDKITSGFGYKSSPFQNTSNVILASTFRMEPGDIALLKKQMYDHKKDREQKGHYRYPCAGSVFKNNRAFGKPTGAILDSLGLKGYKAGNAAISDFHANIIVNTGSATSSDIKSIIDYARSYTRDKLGLELEMEVQLIGDWIV